jgi:hypothetical protein
MRLCRFVPWVLALAGLGTVGRAQVIVPVGYSYSLAPSSAYPDGGGELTDDVLGLSFSHYSEAAEAVAWSGWRFTGPSIDFQFGAPQTFSRIEIGTARHDAAGVALPFSVTAAGTLFNFSNSDLGNDVRDWLVIDGTFATTLVGGVPTLTVGFGNPQAEWLMLDEVRFTAIPEPTGAAAVAAAAAVLFALRRRRVAHC